ncbi:MAG: hypothetical protein M0T72_03800 [Candidatus Dormibacteraeota bacterium]|nr:hypothetical protein [Candidatus Dormibacteraeota bacterium]
MAETRSGRRRPDPSRSTPETNAPSAAESGPAALRARYPNLGTEGVAVSSDSRADVTFSTSRMEGWLVAGALLLASCLAMGIYLVVLHH